MFEESLREELRRKTLLFDTCVLINAATYPRAFLALFSLLKDTDCTPADCTLIRSELFTGISDPKLIAARRNMVDNFGEKDKPLYCIPLNPLESISEDARSIGTALAAPKRYSPDLVDCYIMALLKRYGNNLILITENHVHFTTRLLDRIAVTAIDIPEDRVIALGFYKYNQRKAEHALKLGLAYGQDQALKL